MTDESTHIALTTALLAVPPTYFVTAHAESLLRQGHPFRFHAVPLAASIDPAATSVPATPAVRLPVPYRVRASLAKLAMPIQREQLMRLRPDLIHQHHGTWSGGAVRAAERLGIPLVTTLHGTDVVHAARRRPRGLQRVHASQTRSAFTHSHLLLAVSDHQRTLALDAGAPSARTHVHYQGIDTEYFSPGEHGDAADRPARIVYVGSLIPRKRVDLVISASSDLVRDVPHELLIIGDGPLRRSLEEQASGSDHIRFLGPLDREGVRSHLREADVLLLLSHSEGAGLVILEAQSCGMAAIVTGGDGKAEMIDDGRTGAVLDPEPAPADVARALRDWLPDSPQMRQQVRTAARRFVVSERSVDAGAEELAGYYDTLLRR